MTSSYSLTYRLVVHLLASLSIAYVLTYSAFLLLSISGHWRGNTLYWNDLAADRVYELVIESLGWGQGRGHVGSDRGSAQRNGADSDP